MQRSVVSPHVSDSPIPSPNSSLTFRSAHMGRCLLRGFGLFKWNEIWCLTWIDPACCWIIAVLNSNSLRLWNRWLNAVPSALSLDYCREEIHFSCLSSLWLLTTLTTCFLITCSSFHRDLGKMLVVDANRECSACSFTLLMCYIFDIYRPGCTAAFNYLPYLAELKTSKDERYFPTNFELHVIKRNSLEWHWMKVGLLK